MCASLEVEAALPSRHGLKVCAVIPHFRGLISTSDGSVLGFRGRRLLKFTPPFSTPTLVGLLPQSLLQIASTWRLAERFLRQNVNRMVQTRSGAFLCASPLGILRKAATETRFEVVFRAFQGRRPISLCIDGEDRIYFGEYFKNPKRKSVFVYMSDNDGVSWTRCHEFAAGSIRHIHGLQYDPFHDHIWVLTGDDGDEAQIGVASPGFGQYAVFLQSGQMSRAYSGLCTEHGFIFGSDAPRNRIKYSWPTSTQNKSNRFKTSNTASSILALDAVVTSCPPSSSHPRPISRIMLMSGFPFVPHSGKR